MMIALPSKTECASWPLNLYFKNSTTFLKKYCECNVNFANNNILFDYLTMTKKRKIRPIFLIERIVQKIVFYNLGWNLANSIFLIDISMTFESKYWKKTLTILSFDRVSVEPVFAPLAVVAERVLQALLAEAAEPVARVGIADVDVVVALARFAEIA